MACKDDKGEWVLINGNQTCLIFLYYIIKNRIAMGKMQPNDFIVKTIVTTELLLLMPLLVILASNLLFEELDNDTLKNLVTIPRCV